MIDKEIKEKGMLAKLIEIGIKILLKKECNKISKVHIDIVASSRQIIKGFISKIYIMAEEVNYKDLFFDKVELEANEVKIIFNRNRRELKLKENFTIKFKISLSSNSLIKVLLSNKWNWIEEILSREILNQNKLEDIKIKDGKLLMKSSKYNKSINEVEKINMKAENGNLYLENKAYNKLIKVPIEEKVFIKKVNIENNLVNIFATSSISF